MKKSLALGLIALAFASIGAGDASGYLNKASSPAASEAVEHDSGGCEISPLGVNKGLPFEAIYCRSA